MATIQLDVNRAIESDIKSIYNIANFLTLSIKLNRHNTNVNNVSNPTIQVGNDSIIAGVVPIARYMGEISKKENSNPFVNQWLEFAVTNIRPNIINMFEVEAPIGIFQKTVVQKKDFEQVKTNAEEKLKSAMKYIEEFIAVSDTKFLCTNDKTIADIVVATYVNASVVTIPEKVKQWVDATLTSQPDSKGTNDYEKDTRAFYKSELKIKPEPHYVGLESHIASIFTKALHAAFPMLKTIQPISNVCVSHMKADYQCSSAMAAFKNLKSTDEGKAILSKLSPPTPKGIADAIISNMPKDEAVESADAQPNGFINVFLNRQWAAKKATGLVFNAPGLKKTGRKEIVCVDFSSPNIAKEMHVGHLRSTIIGETICRVLEHSGYDVRRINHTGDWGTQFGMLLTHMRDVYPDFLENPPSIQDLNKFYKASKKRFDAEPEFNKRSHDEVVALQSGNPASKAGWEAFCKVSREMFMMVYSRLDITNEEVGESFYNDIIPGVVNELKAKGLLEEQDGATIAWVKDAIQFPLFLQKSDGGYGYDSTDASAIWYRTQQLKADWLIYVTDLGQADHFKGIFSLGNKAGWCTDVRVDHVGFGVVQGKDGKRFKTRSGDTVRLVDLLDEAKDRVRKILEDRVKTGQTYIDSSEIEEASKAIGYGAVKYADLSSNRQKDYRFDYDAMLNLTGDTAVYLLYAHARLVSIIRKSGQDTRQIVLTSKGNYCVPTEEKAEWNLVKYLLQFPQMIEEFLKDLMPHRICSYLYEISNLVGAFNRDCRVLKSDKQTERILLCECVCVTMRTCFNLLGIQPLMRL